MLAFKIVTPVSQVCFGKETLSEPIAASGVHSHIFSLEGGVSPSVRKMEVPSPSRVGFQGLWGVSQFTPQVWVAARIGLQRLQYSL